MSPLPHHQHRSTSDVAATAVAVARVRGARAARVVAVTGAVDFALHDYAVTAVAMVAGDKECQKAGDEEENAVPSLQLVPIDSKFTRQLT